LHHKTKIEKQMTKLAENNPQGTANIADDRVLAPVSRNFLRRGDKVRMKDNRILTVKSLEFREFVSIEEVGYLSKNDIDTVLE
jgi:hypothetical protein